MLLRRPPRCFREASRVLICSPPQCSQSVLTQLRLAPDAASQTTLQDEVATARRGSASSPYIYIRGSTERWLQSLRSSTVLACVLLPYTYSESWAVLSRDTTKLARSIWAVTTSAYRCTPEISMVPVVNIGFIKRFHVHRLSHSVVVVDIGTRNCTDHC